MSLISRAFARFKKDEGRVLQEKIFRELQRGLTVEQPRFPNDVVLPSGFGVGLPERVVEILLASLTYGPGLRVLDIGHANAMLCHLNMLTILPEPRRVTGMDIVDPVYDTTGYYERSILGDATHIPIPDGDCDVVWCISAMEHFGMDNSGYGEASARRDAADAQALLEFLRILSAGGRCLITVPYGKYEDHEWFQQYDSDRWQSLLDLARPTASVSELYLRHTANEGWHTVCPDDLRDSGYYDERNSGAAGIAVAHITKTSGGEA